MPIAKWDPLEGHLLTRWPKWLDNWGWDNETYQPRGLKVYQEKNNLVAEAVVAGIKPEDVEVTIEDGVLTIKAESTQTEESKKGSQTASYRYYYTAALSGGNWSKAKATIDNGVVKVIIPVAEEKKPKKIKVETKK